MDSTIYSDGDARRISWAIQTPTRLHKQWRDQAKIYRNQVSQIQARCIALHVGLFWGIGVFAIKDCDRVCLAIDNDQMISAVREGSDDDTFVNKRMNFLNMLIRQRKLAVTVQRIRPSDNLATPLLNGRLPDKRKP